MLFRSGDLHAASRGDQGRPWLRYLALCLVALVMLYPLIWLIGASFKNNSEIYTEMGFWPQRFDFGAYAKGWKTSTEYTFATYFLNSFLITIPRIIVTVISCVLVAYAFARFEFWGKKLLFSIMVGTMMLPLIVLRLPQYLMFKEFGWLDTYVPLILPSAFATDTFFVFMLVQFLRGIPRDMEEAAQIDGCNALQLLWHIIVPLLKPAIISVVVGGVLLTGGFGSVIGIFFGTITFAIVNQGIYYTNFDRNWSSLIIGVLLLAAVLMNNTFRNMALSYAPKKKA